MPVARIRSTVSVILVAAWALSGRAVAQDPRAPIPGRLGVNSVVRATLSDGRTITGRYAALGDGRLGVRSESGATDTLTLTRIQTLAVRGRHTKTGAIIGGAAGLAAGIFVGYMVHGVCDAAECDGVRPYLLAIPLFSGGGALLGAAIGAAIPKWKKVYP